MVLDWWWAGICYTRPCPRGGFGEEGGQSGLLQHLWANPEFPTGRKEEEDLLISREWSPIPGRPHCRSRGSSWSAASLPSAPGGASADEPHPGVPQTPGLSTFHIVELNFPFLPALPINAGILWVVQNPVIIHFLL